MNPHSPESSRYQDDFAEACEQTYNELPRAVEERWVEFVEDVLDLAREYAGIDYRVVNEADVCDEADVRRALAEYLKGRKL